jgi:hypothetical protein
MMTIREKLLAELSGMPSDSKKVPRWKDKITKRIGCDRSYIDKVIRDVKRNNDPTL